jgi:hypothetical protein
MSDQTLELIGVIEEQQVLIADLLKYIPPSDATQEIKERMGRIVAATERVKANFVDQAELEKWLKAREERKAKSPKFDLTDYGPEIDETDYMTEEEVEAYRERQKNPEDFDDIQPWPL